MNISNEKIKKAMLVLRAIDHEFRSQIIQFLMDSDRDSGERVKTIYTHLNVSQSMVSNHLSILKRAGVVESHRSGINVYYSINRECMNDINETIKTISEYVNV